MREGTHTLGFSEDEKRVLASVLDELIPPHPAGELPGAGQLGVGTYVAAALQKTPELESMIAEGLSALDALAHSRHATGFVELTPADKVQLLNEQGFILPLTFHAYAGYYQHPRVVAALGREARPPHPNGYEMEPNDLTLLEAVRRRPKLYRE